MSYFSGSAGATAVSRLCQLLVVGGLRGYRLFISPLIGPACRFYPSCSQYALHAVRKHGTLRGLTLTMRRLAKCHPWHPGGVDLVP
ncbi:MAG: membrane protein insertion efficiency factor YidD [Desulfurellaceae bacterium]|nr:membrane protein insertion efficiency factor YidD [Desulfurellaceae bacterium]